MKLKTLFLSFGAMFVLAAQPVNAGTEIPKECESFITKYET